MLPDDDDDDDDYDNDDDDDDDVNLKRHLSPTALRAPFLYL